MDARFVGFTLLVVISGMVTGGYCCNGRLVPNCFHVFLQKLGIQENDGMTFASIILPVDDESHVETCRAMEGSNLHKALFSMVTCIWESDCQTTDTVPEDLLDGLPAMTWENVAEILTGLCAPQCGNMATKYEGALQCGAEMHEHEDEICAAIDWAYSCMKGVIGHCEAVAIVTQITLESTGVTEFVKTSCPGVEWFNVSYEDFQMPTVAIETEPTTTTTPVEAETEPAAAPEFLPSEQSYTVSAGDTARLTCSVANLGSNTVMWMRKDQQHPLTIGLFSYTDDERISVEHGNINDWTLVIQNVNSKDAGWYVCIVSNGENMALLYEVQLTVNAVGPPACVEDTVQECFSGLGQALEIPGSPINGVHLFLLINPPNNEQQQRTCTALTGFDYDTVRSCVVLSGCANTVMLPSDMVTGNIPDYTWSGVLDLLPLMCQPECANVADMYWDINSCEFSAFPSNSNDICWSVEQEVGCYTEAVGSCPMLTLRISTALENRGVYEAAQTHCPNIGGEEQTPSVTEPSPTVDNHSTVEASADCDVVSIQQCFVDMATASGSNELAGINMMSFLIGDPSDTPDQVNSKQQLICSAFGNYDTSLLRTCVANTNCADNSIADGSQMTFTWGQLVEALIGICEPGCENLGNKNQEVLMCMASMSNPSGDICGSLDTAFQCLRSSIGQCQSLITLTATNLDVTGLAAVCPDINMNIASEEQTPSTTEPSPFVYNITEEIDVCGMSSIQQCFIDMAMASGNHELAGVNMISFLVGDPFDTPDQVNSKQQLFCSALSNYDASLLRTCLANTNCADSAIADGSQMTFTWGQFVDFIIGICEPGCENFGNMNQEILACTASISNPDICGSLDTAFQCLRSSIGQCESLVTLTATNLDVTGLAAVCPGLDLSLESQRRKKKLRKVEGRRRSSRNQSAHVQRSHQKSRTSSKRTLQIDNDVEMLNALRRQFRKIY